MTDQEQYRCESHERRVTILEKAVHEQDTKTQLLRNDLEAQAKNIDRVTLMVERATQKIEEILPKIAISNAYRTGLMFVLAIVGSKIFEMIISKIFR